MGREAVEGEFPCLDKVLGWIEKRKNVARGDGASAGDGRWGPGESIVRTGFLLFLSEYSSMPSSMQLCIFNHLLTPSRMVLRMELDYLSALKYVCSHLRRRRGKISPGLRCLVESLPASTFIPCER